MPFEETMPPHPKELGAFYTPKTIAEVLAEWIVRSGSERLLEPSVGDGALLEAAVARARSLLGGESRLRFLTCDLDPDAIAAASQKLPAGSETRAIDFLQLDVGSTGRFQGIIANPPFTRNHTLSATRRKILRNRFNVSGAAGLWVYFLIHALEFLVPGGRLAAIVPASALFSNYGRAVLKRLAMSFATVELRQIVDKPLWVNRAAERGAIVLADGYCQGSSMLPNPVLWSSIGASASHGNDCDTAFEELAASSSPFESLATLRIGIVTGYNAVFLINEDERLAMGIDRSDVVPVVGRTRHVPGLWISAADLIDQASVGGKTWLLAPNNISVRGSPARRQLAKISARRRSRTVWFKKRHPWWRIELGPPCNAVFTYMNDLGPRLVLAKDELRCTNTLHQVFFQDTTSEESRIAAALTMISTFGQLAAERVGRSYGGGVLKFELADARRMPILPSTKSSLRAPITEADLALRKGDREAARTIADKALIAPLLGRPWCTVVRTMELELTQRRAARRGLLV